MQPLVFDLGSCVRVASKASTCQACVQICPVDTIVLTQGHPSFTPSACVGCGGCVAVCPTGAFGGVFDPIKWMFDFLAQDDTVISCKKNITCASALSAQNLLSLALLSPKEITLDVGHCAGCVWEKPLATMILDNVAQAQTLLGAMGKPCNIKAEALGAEQTPKPAKEVSSRRDLLKRFTTLEGAVKTQAAFEYEVAQHDEKVFAVDGAVAARIRAKKLPQSRKFLFLALKKTSKPQSCTEVSEAQIGFVSQKVITKACTNCQICYRICPSGALSSDAKCATIFFDPTLCLKCGLCHDVCEPHAITRAPMFDVEEFFAPTLHTLARFTVYRCDECGAPFTYTGGERLCPRCKVEEDEAHALHGGMRC